MIAPKSAWQKKRSQPDNDEYKYIISDELRTSVGIVAAVKDLPAKGKCFSVFVAGRVPRRQESVG
jgi:hypothetical protein